MTTKTERIKHWWMNAFWVDKVICPSKAKRLGLYFLGLSGLGMVMVGGYASIAGSEKNAFALLVFGMYFVIMYFYVWVCKASDYIKSKEKQNTREA